MHYVTVIGSGNVGANTAFFIAEKGITDVALYDIRDGLAKGKGAASQPTAPPAVGLCHSLASFPVP